MAIVGHWKNFEEAQKLVQSVLLAGIVEEIIETGHLVPLFPVTGITGKSLIYNREKTLPAAKFYGIHEPLTWISDVEYTDQIEVELKQVGAPHILDHFMAKNYKNPNDYKAIVLKELIKGCTRTIEQTIIYGRASGTQEFNGLHHLVTQYIDAAEAALSLYQLRRLVDLVKPKPDILLMSPDMARWIDTAYFDQGIQVDSSAHVWNQLGVISWAERNVGGRITRFDGVPIIRSDFMVLEDANTGVQHSTKRTTAAGTVYSIFAVRFGQIESGGLCMLVGADTGGPDFFKVVELPELENYFADGIRLEGYVALALGSTKGLAVMTDIASAAPTA